MFRFEQLEVWQLATEYGKQCYEIANCFPKYEIFALGDQLRRAAVSISNNIAEGSVGSSANFKKYIITAIGSTLETVNILHFALNMGYIEEAKRKEAYQQAEVIIKKLRSFSNSFKK